jgi:hypothetical protein
VSTREQAAIIILSPNPASQNASSVYPSRKKTLTVLTPFDTEPRKAYFLRPGFTVKERVSATDRFIPS